MLSNRSKDTALEIRIRSALHRAGLRFRKNVRPVPSIRCEADVVFRAARVAVFVDGCFWHGCPEHARRPSERSQNRQWWLDKLDRNIARDRRNDGLLEEAGWRVLHLWEHEAVPDAVAKVKGLLAAALSQPPRA